MIELLAALLNVFSLVALFLFLIHILFFILLFICRKKSFETPQQSGSTCLFVMAHPDDETMFFAPTILRLVEGGTRVFILCVTTGNTAGLRTTRKRELGMAVESLGMRVEDVTILDMADFSDGFVQWPESGRLAKIILKSALSIDCKWIVTFDKHGISSHPNHIGCFDAVQFLVNGGFLPPNMQVFVLETVNILRKYSSVLDVVPSFLSSYFSPSCLLFASGPLTVYNSMRKHKSQLVWFRYLYLIFSRYVIINTLKKVVVTKVNCK